MFKRNVKTRKSNRKNRNTKKNTKNQITKEHVKARMNLPIGTSSYGIPVTDEIIADNKRILEKYT